MHDRMAQSGCCTFHLSTRATRLHRTRRGVHLELARAPAVWRGGSAQDSGGAPAPAVGTTPPTAAADGSVETLELDEIILA
eukprot:3385904-Prymnesium_polylepis.1